MNVTRRHWLAGLGALGALRVPASARVAGTPAQEPAVDLDLSQWRPADGKLKATALAQTCARRIEALDRRGPSLHAVIERNPDTLRIAAELDTLARHRQARGALHGLPVLLKDNIATGDRMHTSAGSLALAGRPALADATLVTRLRAAGAVVLGKTNLSEWANIRSTRSVSGWSARGGQTRNPYALDRNPSGSSSGSAVAVAAGYVPFAVGTETDGSIVSPASSCGIVGIKPTVGLVSRHGVVPISTSQDTAGAMATTVRAAAALLAAMAGRDEADPATAQAPLGIDLLARLDPGALAGARIGVVRASFGEQPGVLRCMEQALGTLRLQGAVLVDPVELPPADKYGDAELEVLLTEFRVALPDWVAKFAPWAPFRTLAELIEWDRQHRAQEMVLFDQELFERAAATGPLDGAKYLEARATCVRFARTEGIDRALEKDRLDALVAPTGDPAWLTDTVNGDRSGPGFSSPAAVAGYPHITVPMGLVDGLPVGLSFVGGAFQDATLIGLAHAYEQASRMRRPPRFLPTALPPGT